MIETILKEMESHFPSIFMMVEFNFVNEFIWADPGGTGQPVTKVKQAPSTSSICKNKFNIHCPPMEDL